MKKPFIIFYIFSLTLLFWSCASQNNTRYQTISKHRLSMVQSRMTRFNPGHLQGKNQQIPMLVKAHKPKHKPIVISLDSSQLPLSNAIALPTIAKPILHHRKNNIKHPASHVDPSKFERPKTPTKFMDDKKNTPPKDEPELKNEPFGVIGFTLLLTSIFFFPLIILSFISSIVSYIRFDNGLKKFKGKKYMRIALIGSTIIILITLVIIAIIISLGTPLIAF